MHCEKEGEAFWRWESDNDEKSIWSEPLSPSDAYTPPPLPLDAEQFVKKVSLIQRVDEPFMFTYTPPPSLPRQFTNRVGVSSFPLISIVCSLVMLADSTPPLLSLDISLNVEHSIVKFPFPLNWMRGEEENEREVKEREVNRREPF